MDKTQTIPSPAWLKWREFRIQFLPVIIFLIALTAVFSLWKHEVAAPHLVGEVEMLTGQVISPADGLVQELLVERFDRVTAGQPVAILRRADPEAMRASLAAIAADLQVTQARMAQDEQRIRQNNEQLRLDWMRERVALATAKVELQFAENELARVKVLYDNQLVSEGEFDLAENLVRTRATEIEERSKLVGEIEASLERLGGGSDADREGSVISAINAAIAAEESQLTEQEKPATLRASIDGIVSWIERRAGERIRRGELVLSIHSTEPRRIIGYARQPVTQRPEPGDRVRVQSRAAKGVFGMGVVLDVGASMELIEPHLLPFETAQPETGLPVIVSLPDNLEVTAGELVDLALIQE